MIDVAHRMTAGVGLAELAGPVKQAALARAFGDVPRHMFVPDERRMRAYLDAEIPLGNGRDAMRPSTAAELLDAARIGPGERVLAVMAGDAYPAALAAAAGCVVTAVEPIEALAAAAAEAFARAGFADRVAVLHAMPTEAAAFDAIIVLGAVERTPRSYLTLLADDGIMVVPISRGASATLHVHQRTARGSLRREAGELDIPSLVGVDLPGA